MDLSALSGLKKRVLQPVPDSVDVAPVEQVPATAPEPAPETLETSPAVEPAPEVPDTLVVEPAADVADAAEEPAADTAAVAASAESENQPAPTVAAPAMIEPAEEEHSGHVTLYLPKDLNRWLGEHHDSTGISYPGIVLNAISWVAGENRFAQIFAPEDSPIPANDIFGRAPAIPKLARGSIEPETRPLRFRSDHMRVIISLARTWTADNRNAFFVGVLTAYRDQQNKE
jgi:hypothetical protein